MRHCLYLLLASGGNEIEFTCDQGTVSVVPETVPEDQKH
jgi:hypothetical protein